MRAVIFDLWDTIVDYPVEEARELERAWAQRLGVEPDAFHEQWLAARLVRETGSLAESFRSAGVPEELLEEFARMRRDSTRRLLLPRAGVLETLRELARRRLLLGLISVCSEDVALVWENTPFAGLFGSTVFSATCGLRKPDAEIYRRACRELGVEPAECMFVGDGANDELAGAERVGMRSVLIHRLGTEPVWPEARAWRGARITAIPEVLALCA